MLWQVPDAALIGGAFFIDSRAKAETITIPDSINSVITGGYYDAGDGGGAEFVRAAGPLSDGASFQSGDGAWWLYVSPLINVAQFGASVSQTPSVNHTAITNAIEFGYDLVGSGRKFTIYILDQYIIDDTVEIGSFCYLQGPGRLSQNTDNIAVVKINRDALNQFWGINQVDIGFVIKQPNTNTNAFGIDLCTENQVTYEYFVTNLSIFNCFRGVTTEARASANSFLATFDGLIIANCSDYGFYFTCASGANTTLNIGKVWVQNTSGAVISTSKGFFIENTRPVNLGLIVVDHVAQRPFFIRNCDGTINNIAIEQCDMSASSGALYFGEIANCNLDIGTYNINGGSATISGTATATSLRISSTSSVNLFELYENAIQLFDTSSDSYYSASVENTASFVNIQKYRYSASANPSPNGSLADFAVPPKVKMFNGNLRATMIGGKNIIYAGSAPVSGTWAAGDICYYNTPSTFIGAVCITAGTPGIWKTFGAITP